MRLHCEDLLLKKILLWHAKPEKEREREKKSSFFSQKKSMLGGGKKDRSHNRGVGEGGFSLFSLSLSVLKCRLGNHLKENGHEGGRYSQTRLSGHSKPFPFTRDSHLIPNKTVYYCTRTVSPNVCLNLSRLSGFYCTGSRSRSRGRFSLFFYPGLVFAYNSNSRRRGRLRCEI